MRLCLPALLLIAASAVPSVAQTLVEIQPVRNFRSADSDSSCEYKASDPERPYLKNLSKGELTNGAASDLYSIHGKAGKYIGWFGIVRGITPAANAGGDVKLLVEHRYFDGQTDCQAMVVSRTGGGDFQAGLLADPSLIPPLSLVRVYGVVTGEKDNVPQVLVQYVRVWPWFTFTFANYGPPDQSNPRWATFATPSGWKSHTSTPTTDYYRSLLGDPTLFGLNFKP